MKRILFIDIRHQYVICDKFISVNINGLENFFNKISIVDKVLFLFLIIGIGLIGTGLFRGIVEDNQVQVEVIKNDKKENGHKVVVDVGGGVVAPGVYELPSDSRIKDCLVAAKGLSLNADRNWVQKNINLAELVKDGQKIYIPTTENQQGEGYANSDSSFKKISINSAGISELDTLKGIGAVRAQQIIDGRPYRDVDELVTKGVLSKTVLEGIRDQLSVY